MNILKKKLGKNSGFTLMEMLIVVAIIAILIAIAIPALAGSLDKARKASDDANLRSAKALALISYMTDDLELESDGSWDGYYDIPAADGGNAEGTLEKGNAPGDGNGYGQCKTHKGQYVEVTIADGDVSVDWETSGGCNQ